jgi:hypothetical protein
VSIHKHVGPRLGHVRLQSVDRLQIRALYQKLVDAVPGCERFLRARGIDSIASPVVFGIIGIAKIDNLLNLC